MEEETSNGKVEAESPKVGRHDRDEKQEANQVSAELKPDVGAGNSLLVIEAQQVDGAAEQESFQTQTENLEEDEQVLVSDNTALVPVETVRSSSPLAEEPIEDEHVLVYENTTFVPIRTLGYSSPLAEEPSEDKHVLVSENTTLVPVESVGSSSPVAKEPSEYEEVLVSDNTTLVAVETVGSSSPLAEESPREDEQVHVSDNTTLVPVETPGSSSSLVEEPREDVQVQAKTDEPTQVPSVEGEVGFSEMNHDEQEIPTVEDNPAEPSAQSSEEAPVNQNRDLPPDTTNHSPIIPLTQPTLQRTSWRSCCGLLQVLRGSET